MAILCNRLWFSHWFGQLLDWFCRAVTWSASSFEREPSVNAFEVIFIFLVLGSLVTLAVAGGLFLFRRRGAVIRLARTYSLCLGAYAAIVLVSSLLVSRPQLRLGEPLCFDDWCITIRSVETIGTDEYTVSGSLSNRAKQAPQRETGVILYLTDSSRRHYDAVPTDGETAFDIRLLPNETVSFSRNFRLSSGQRPIGVVVAHEGGFPIE